MENNFLTRFAQDAVFSAALSWYAEHPKFVEQFIAIRCINELSIYVEKTTSRVFPQLSLGLKTAAGFAGAASITYFASLATGYPLEKLFFVTLAWRAYLTYQFNQEILQKSLQIKQLDAFEQYLKTLPLQKVENSSPVHSN